MYSKRFWGCLNCRSRKNDVAKDVRRCKTCHAEKPSQQQVIVLQPDQRPPEVYLCRAVTAASLPSVTVFRTSPLPEVQLKMALPIVSNNLRECIIEAIANNNVSQLGFDKPVVVADTRKDESQIDKDSDNNNSNKNSNSISYNKNDNNKNNSSNSTAHGDKLGSQQKKPKGHPVSSVAPVHTQIDKGRNVEVFSLFDKILDNATKEVYDLRIGRYIHTDTLMGKPEEADHVKQRNYVGFMEREYVGMRNIVSKVIEERNYDFNIKNLIKESGKNAGTLEPREKVPCPICEFLYPKEELLGLISFKAVMNWRESRNVPIDPKDPRATKFRMHDATRICVFCNQMFDENFGSVIDDQISVAQSVESESKIKGALSCSNAVYKKIMKKMIEKQKENLEVRPLSRMRQGISLAQLKMKAESPSANLVRAASNGGEIPVTSSFLRDKYNTVEALLMEKKKYEVEERLIARKISQIERKLGKGKSSSPHRHSASQGSSRQTYNKDAARARIRAKSAQILRDKELNKIHPSKRRSKRAFLTGADSDSETASVYSVRSNASSNASNRGGLQSARSVSSVKSTASGASKGSNASSSGRSAHGKGAKSKRALSADHANRRIWSDRSGITPKKSNNNSSSKDNNSNNSSNIAKKLKFSPSRNNNQETSTKMRDIRSRGASRGIEISLDTIVESDRNLPKMSDPEKPRKPLLLVVRNKPRSTEAGEGASASESIVKRIELPVVIPVKPSIISAVANANRLQKSNDTNSNIKNSNTPSSPRHKPSNSNSIGGSGSLKSIIPPPVVIGHSPSKTSSKKAATSPMSVSSTTSNSSAKRSKKTKMLQATLSNNSKNNYNSQQQQQKQQQKLSTSPKQIEKSQSNNSALVDRSIMSLFKSAKATTEVYNNKSDINDDPQYADDFEASIPIVINNDDQEEVFEWCEEDADQFYPISRHEDDDEVQIAQDSRTGDLDSYEWATSGTYQETNEYKDDWIVTPPVPSSSSSDLRVVLSRSSSSRSSSRLLKPDSSNDIFTAKTPDLRVLSRGSSRYGSTTAEAKTRPHVNTPGETRFLEVIKPTSSNADFMERIAAVKKEMSSEGYSDLKELEDELRDLQDQMVVLDGKGVAKTALRYKSLSDRSIYLTSLLRRYIEANEGISRGNSSGNQAFSAAEQTGFGLKAKTKKPGKVVYGVAVRSHPYLREGGAAQAAVAASKKKK